VILPTQLIRPAHVHSVANEEAAHGRCAGPCASANHDLTPVVFTSNWGRSGTDQAEMCMIVMPDGWWEAGL
jgi:hypothetical protein